MNRAMRTVENGNLYIGIFNRMMWATQVITDQVCVTTCVTAIFSAIDEFSIIDEVPQFWKNALAPWEVNIELEVKDWWLTQKRKQ